MQNYNGDESVVDGPVDLHSHALTSVHSAHQLPFLAYFWPYFFGLWLKLTIIFFYLLKIWPFIFGHIFSTFWFSAYYYKSLFRRLQLIFLKVWLFISEACFFNFDGSWHFFESIIFFGGLIIFFGKINMILKVYFSIFWRFL